MNASIPNDEPARIAALSECRILDTPAEDAYDDIALLAAQICSAPIAAVSLVDEHRQWFKSILGLNIQETPRSQSFCAHTILGSELTVVADTLLDERFADNPLVTGDPHIRFYAGAPLVTDDGFNLGSLCVIDCVPRHLTPAQMSALRVLARQVSTQLELRRRVEVQQKLIVDLERAETTLTDYSHQLEFQRSQLEVANCVLSTLATSDGLTGVKNHGAFQERLAEECMRSERRQSPLSVIMMDVDTFKEYNDTFGHPEGDRVLKTIAGLLEASARESDVVARYGGEEFALVLPETSQDQALHVAERMRRAIETAPWELRPVTASLGVSTVSQGLYIAADMVAAADRALYASKTAGRNRTTHVASLTLAEPLAIPW